MGAIKYVGPGYEPTIVLKTSMPCSAVILKLRRILRRTFLLLGLIASRKVMFKFCIT